MDNSDNDEFTARHELYESSREEILSHTNEVIEDFTEKKDLSKNTSSDALCFSEETPKIKPRPYQLEMLNEALERNIIVAVSPPFVCGTH